MTAPPGIGHNSGTDFDGYAGRLHQWRKARKDLIKGRMPLEVVRMRVRRAAALGLDYGTYASVRASTGRDIVALLFSSSALGMLRQAEMEALAAQKLERIAASRGALIHAPLPVTAVGPLDWAYRAPAFTDSWSAARERLIAVLKARHLPADGVLMIGATAVEREWCAAARAAGWVPSERYFAT